MQDGRAITWKREESPNAAGQGRRLTTGEGDFKESATESKLPAREKVKRRGKSSPLPRQRGGHCKPRPAQDVRAFRAVRSLFDIARAYRQRYAQTDDRPRQNSAYRPSCFFEKYAPGFYARAFFFNFVVFAQKNKSTMSHIVLYFRHFTIFFK